MGIYTCTYIHIQVCINIFMLLWIKKINYSCDPKLLSLVCACIRRPIQRTLILLKVKEIWCQLGFIQEIERDRNNEYNFKKIIIKINNMFRINLIISYLEFVEYRIRRTRNYCSIFNLSLFSLVNI